MLDKRCLECQLDSSSIKRHSADHFTVFFISPASFSTIVLHNISRSSTSLWPSDIRDFRSNVRSSGEQSSTFLLHTRMQKAL